MSPHIRQLLEALEQQTASAAERAMVEATGDRVGRVEFTRAAATSLLSIAASVFEVAAERHGHSLDIPAFEAAARDSAEFVKERRRRSR